MIQIAISAGHILHISMYTFVIISLSHYSLLHEVTLHDYTANTGGERTPSSRWRRTLPSIRLIIGKLTDTAHLLDTHTSWGYCRWYEEHWGGVSSHDKQSFSRNSNLKSCVVTRVIHISVFPVSRVTVFHVEGDATVDEGDACLIGQTVIDISRFRFC